uniref:Uncharacterized protein n=1 Tax=Lepeophtheirus salmonis TaxID=72036 RepID=A0A0K2UJ09_LEPSM
MWSGKIKCTKCNWTTDNEENLFMKYRNKELSFQLLKNIIPNNHINECDILLNILDYFNSLSTSDFVSENI